MEIIHILKSGEKLASINGHVVKAEENPRVYEMISGMIEKRRGEEHEKEKIKK